MSVSTQLGGPTPFNQIQTTCPQVSDQSFNACVEAMSNLASKTAEAITNLFGGIKGFCKLPELPFEDCKMGGTGYLDRFKPQDLCGPVMRGIDSAERPFVTFGVQQFVADSKTHERLDTYGQNSAFTLFQRYTDDAHVWVSAGHPSRDMLPLETATQQYVDDKGKKSRSLERLDTLLKQGFLIKGERQHQVGDEKYNIELHLANSFKQVTPMCPNKSEL